MDLYASGSAVEIRYPIGQTDAQYLAEELAARLNDLVSDAADPFSGLVSAGVPTTDVEAIYVGRQEDWAVPWWESTNDFGVKVVSGADCLNPACTGSELHIIARDYPLLLRAVWLTLHDLGWRHYMPNGVDGLEELWVYRNARTTISTHMDRVWAGVVDHLKPAIAGGSGILTWSDGSNHLSGTHPNGLQEGDFAGALGDVPAIESDPESAPARAWLRHMGWTSSSSLQTNAAWSFVIAYDADPAHGPTLSLWDAVMGHYTDQHKLFTDSQLVWDAALAYANDEFNQGSEWVSLSRADGELEWDIDFGDVAFGAKLPVTRQIELANYVAMSPAYNGTGIVIQAYGRTAEQPEPNIMPHLSKVCVIMIESYRPAGRTIEAIISDYKDASGNALCPLGLYQYLHSSAWGLGDITAKAGSPQLLVDAANRVKFLPAVSPKVLTGEAMPEFGLYGFGYYCYMRMVLDIGRVSADFTLADFKQHAHDFLTDMFPTLTVRTAIGNWYELLLDREHKPLLSGHLVRCLWDELQVAMDATTAGSYEEKRVVELGKFTRYLDLRNQYEAYEAAGVGSESIYNTLMEWVFRIRDSGLVDTYGLFFNPLNDEHHAMLGLDSIFGALNEPPGDNRGADADRSAWITTVPSVDNFKDPGTNWIAEGIANNSKHGLTDTSFSARLEAGSYTDPRARQEAPALRPYRAKDKMRLWLIPGAATFECKYKRDGGDAYVEFINQATDNVDAEFVVDSDGYEQQDASLTAGQLYEIRLTTYGNDDRLWLDWWSGFTQRHHLSFDPGRDGDPCGFQTDRSFYFLIPAGVSAIHFYASKAAELKLFYLDSLGNEQEDTTFNPVARAYQSHSVGGSGRRVARIAGIQQNDPGFWLLNCPNLFALHPEELLRPEDA